MSNNYSDLIVVIRTVRERTFEACRELVFKQIPKHLVYIVSEQPFETTLRRCYEIGIDSGAKWMMTIDADVLLREGAIKDFLLEAEALPHNYFQLEGLLHDKLTGIYRKVGHRIYRTEYLNKAINLLPQPREAIRPEYTTLLRMEKLGYLSQEVNIVFGIHDYEQYFSDIYRKAFVHAQKHPQWIPDFIKRWKCQASQDEDYRIALRGLYDGLLCTQQVAIDKRDFIQNAKFALEDLELSKKNQIQVADIGFRYVDSILSAMEPLAQDKSMTSNESMRSRSISRLKERYHQLGLINLFFFSLGIILLRTGNWLKQKAQANSKNNLILKKSALVSREC